MVCPATNDRMQYNWTLDRARKRGETKVVRKLEQNGPSPYLGSMVRVARKYAASTLPNFRYMWADMLAAGGHPAGGDIKALINVEDDANAMSILVDRYFELLQTPYKEPVWLERSAHSPRFEEADRFNRFMIDTVLTQTRGRAPDPGGPVTPARDQNTRGSQA
jgi:hypothetical protein